MPFQEADIILPGELPAHKGTAPNADIHYEKGLDCTDCHTFDEIHGNGVAYSSQMEAITVKCTDCHTDPEKEVKGMVVTQYSLEIPSHEIHDQKLDCTACHSGWLVTCENCHLETGQLDRVNVDNFYLARSNDGLVKPFINMTTTYNNSTHTAFAEWGPHTTTKNAKNCEFCHENTEIFIGENDGVILGAGGSFLSQETIDTISQVSLDVVEEEKNIPVFVPYIGTIIILAVYLLMKRK